VNLE